MAKTNLRAKLYLVRAGRSGEDEDFVLENNLAVIGFDYVPSIEQAKSLDEALRIVGEADPGATTKLIRNHAGQLWRFAHDIRQDDLVVLPLKRTPQIAIGRVSGPYRYRVVKDVRRHTRAVTWVINDLPRTAIQQDLLNSFGAFLTVCNISRNRAVERIQAVLRDGADPGFTAGSKPTRVRPKPEEEADSIPDISQSAHDQIVHEIQAKFRGHALTSLVAAVLRADGWETEESPPGPDGGVDILAGRGSLGLDKPRLCVQVKSQVDPANVTVYRTLQGTMQSFKAEQGLLVCWGGFNRAVLRESRQEHFTVRLWDSSDLVEAIYRTYESLPEEIQADLPLKRVWMLVHDEAEN